MKKLPKELVEALTNMLEQEDRRADEDLCKVSHNGRSLQSSFTWVKTPEGFAFWKYVHERLTGEIRYE